MATKNRNTKYLALTIIAGLALVCFAGPVTRAASSTSSSSSTDSTNPLIIPNDPEQDTSLPQRLASRRTSLKVSLSIAQQQSIIKNCTLAQTALQSQKTKDTTAAGSRQQTYSNLAKQLAQMVNNLKRQSVDTSELGAIQTKFDNAIDQYLTDAETYKTAMDDGVVMDCGSDPVDFEATLLSARQVRGQLAQDVAAVKALVPQLTKALGDTEQSLISSKTSTQNGKKQ